MRADKASAPAATEPALGPASDRTRSAASPRSAARKSALILVLALVEGFSLFVLSAPDQQGSASINALFAILGIAAFLVLMGMALWFARDAARSKRAALSAQERSEEASRHQREAEARARIAGELHDSVGHDLTAIIALTEGVEVARQADADLTRVLERVNELARAGLADTRRAVADLENAEMHDEGRRPLSSEERSWAQIPSLLGEARMAAMATPYSEMGRRPDDQQQADLAYCVVREGVTNALRHAERASCIAVSVEHLSDGSCRIAVRDDGVAASAATGDDGTGLRRLAARVDAVSGTIGWGPDEGGWSLEATLPPSSRGAAQ